MRGEETRSDDIELAFDDPGFLLGDTDEIYRRLRRERPVAWCERARLWALSKHADVLHVSKNPDLFCSGRGVLVNDPLRQGATDLGPPSIIQMDPPAHNRFRKLVVKAFTPRMVSALEPRIREVARGCVESLQSGERVDLVERLAVPLPVTIIADMLGVSADDRDDFKRWSDAMIEGGDARSEDTMLQAAELFDYFRRIMEARRTASGRPQDDLVSALINAEVDGERLSDDEVLIFCMTLLVAGNETTRHLISGGAKALMDFPEQRRRLASDLSLIPTAVEEMLRWVTPVKAFARTATRDTVIRGQEIERGDYVLMLYGSANRDEDVWGATGSQFDVTRSSAGDHVAFGFGQHFCLGANLARLEARVLFEELLSRRPHFEATGEAEPLRSTIMNGLVRLPVTMG